MRPQDQFVSVERFACDRNSRKSSQGVQAEVHGLKIAATKRLLDTFTHELQADQRRTNAPTCCSPCLKWSFRQNLTILGNDGCSLEVRCHGIAINNAFVRASVA